VGRSFDELCRSCEDGGGASLLDERLDLVVAQDTYEDERKHDHQNDEC
jgi:hypothetical protein